MIIMEIIIIEILLIIWTLKKIKIYIFFVQVFVMEDDLLSLSAESGTMAWPSQNIALPVAVKEVSRFCKKETSEYVKSLCHCVQQKRGAGRSSEIERSLMMRWVVGSILHGVDPLSYFSFQPVLHDWCNKDCGMCYPVCGMVHTKEPLLLIDKSSLCGGSGFPFSLSVWSLTICLTPYNRR